MNILAENLRDIDISGNLITVTATAHLGQARLTGQINGRTVREETAFAVTDRDRLASLAQQMMETLFRSTGAVVFTRRPELVVNNV